VPARSARAEREVSAGGVVVRGRECVVIVPTRRTADGRRVLALPKGHVDPGETPDVTARREVREEAGVEATVREELGAVRYFYVRDGRRIAKVVTFFLLDYTAGSVDDHDHEVQEARWMALDEAVRALSHRGERDMAARALRRLG
jgi:8-oxo-dGTP pyrophosphatase MutT (NUDIX family)